MEEEDVIGLSNVTWPRSRIPAKLLSELQATSQLQSTLSALKTRATQQNDAETIKMIEKLNQILTKDDPADDPTMPNQNQTVNSRIGNGFINRMRRNTLASQPPHFGSMILCAKPNDPHVRSSNHFVDEDGQVVEEPQPSTTNAATNEAIPESEIPLYAKVIPTILLFLLSTGYIFGGTYVFQTLDPSLGNKSFHEVFMLPFQINFTVGWGNLPIVTTLGQLFCILYALCGVPLALSALTRLGKFFFTNFSVDWILNSAVLRHTPGTEDKILSFPVLRALNLLIAHLLLGFILFNGFLGDMGVVRSLYFNYMAIAMIGFGDIAPETVNMLQTLIVSLYLLVGMIFLAVTHVAFSYWIQRIFFVVIKEKIYQRHLRNAAKRRLSTSYSFKTDNHSINA